MVFGSNNGINSDSLRSPVMRGVRQRRNPMLKLFRNWIKSTKKATLTQTSDPGIHHILRKEKVMCQGGDPFSEHRRRNILPEKYEFGMNCLLDCFTQMAGLESAQKTYEVIKQDSQSYTICKDCPPATPETGVPILFTIANLDVVHKTSHRAARLQEVTLFAYCEPEPEETLGLDVYINTVNKALHGMNLPALDELHMIAFRTEKDRIKDCSDLLSSGISILYKSQLYKSKAAELWHFLTLHNCDDIYFYGPQGRKVVMPYCVDEAGKILLVAPRSTKQKWFGRDQELDKSELKNIIIVYLYKPYDETIERFCKLLVDRE